MDGIAFKKPMFFIVTTVKTSNHINIKMPRTKFVETNTISSTLYLELIRRLKIHKYISACLDYHYSLNMMHTFAVYLHLLNCPF
jgi:hypothetical protein